MWNVLFLEVGPICALFLLMKWRRFVSLGLCPEIFWLETLSPHYPFLLPSIFLLNDVVVLQSLPNYLDLILLIWRRRSRKWWQLYLLRLRARAKIEGLNRWLFFWKWIFHDIIREKKNILLNRKLSTICMQNIYNQVLLVDLKFYGATGSASIKSIELIEFISYNSLFYYSPKMQNRDPSLSSFALGSTISTWLSWLIKRLEEGIFKDWDPEPENLGLISSFLQKVNSFFPWGLSMWVWLD